MEARAIFIDMDGTLLTNSNEISERNMEAVSRLANQGVKVFLATGRQYEITAPYHAALGLKTPMICLNGASIHDGITGNAIHTRQIHLDEEHFHYVTASVPCNIMIHTTDGLFCRQNSAEVAEWVKESGIPPRYIGDLRKAEYQHVLKYSIRTGAQSPELSRLFKDKGHVIDWEDGFEIVAPGVSKWSAINKLLQAFRINSRETVAIGDGPNDLQMLQSAGTGVAMANAHPEVKAAADFITTHHQRDGLAEFIERYLINSFAV
ncbi:HAD family hydrolase [Virgibacillus xinjiangensis]|uniref:HAD family hydrolase n=1 Tax=Virgibacillus xinjiangensis TaxID=393090 RepID=A0ABV7CVK5_9BACI